MSFHWTYVRANVCSSTTSQHQSQHLTLSLIQYQTRGLVFTVMLNGFPLKYIYTYKVLPAALRLVSSCLNILEDFHLRYQDVVEILMLKQVLKWLPGVAFGVTSALY